jgi:hypothetical protein
MGIKSLSRGARLAFKMGGVIDRALAHEVEAATQDTRSPAEALVTA